MSNLQKELMDLKREIRYAHTIANSEYSHKWKDMYNIMRIKKILLQKMKAQLLEEARKKTPETFVYIDCFLAVDSTDKTSVEDRLRLVENILNDLHLDHSIWSIQGTKVEIDMHKLLHHCLDADI
uniref:Uncharacterized protein n=1 Tax=viral metagenome TaxID=1070528 RepID=A0A6C0EC24_9ZZZZ